MELLQDSLSPCNIALLYEPFFPQMIVIETWVSTKCNILRCPKTTTKSFKTINKLCKTTAEAAGKVYKSTISGHKSSYLSCHILMFNIFGLQWFIKSVYVSCRGTGEGSIFIVFLVEKKPCFGVNFKRVLFIMWYYIWIPRSPPLLETVVFELEMFCTFGKHSSAP